MLSTWASLRRRLSRGAPVEAGRSVGEASVPPGRRIYAVGDIHGRNDLLVAMLGLIAADARRETEAACTLVLLGDYVDRGPDSRAVVDTVMNIRLPGFEVIALKGNHEQLMLDFLVDPPTARSWLTYGGDAALLSYGAPLRPGVVTEDKLTAAHRTFAANLPQSHLDFLENLPSSVAIGDYFFVHAGIDPKRSLEDQADDTLLWTRGPFVESRRLFSKVIVHGHTVTEAPDVRPNRIGIDTGAYYSGVLTCAVLEGRTLRFLQTCPNPSG